MAEESQGDRIMISRQPHFLLAQAGLLLLTSLAAQAQQPEAISIRLSDVYTVPGTEAAIPIYLASQGQVQVVEIGLEVSFPDDLLSFLRLERAFRGFEKTAGKFEAESEAGQDDRSTVQINISIEKGDEPLLDGLIGYLVFQVDEKAQLGETFLETAGLTLKSLSQEVVQNTQSRGAKMVILSEEDLLSAITACFFYIH